MIILIITFLSVLFSLISVWLIRKIASRHHIGSLPSPRKMHKKFVPLLGGGGVTAGMIAALIISQFAGILPFSIWTDYIFFWLGLLVILSVGVWDDIKGIQSRIKFMGQGIAALLLILGGCKIQSFGGPMGEGFSLGAFAIPFTFLWIIFIINAVNLMDGLDGLAGGIGLIVITGFVIISGGFENRFLFILGLGLAGGLLGFLRYNYHPASIFMGDTGSLQLGYIFAFFSIESLKIASSHQIYFLTSLTLLALPITDTLVAFLRRLSLGQSPFLADKQHIHHRLMKLGLSHLQTVWVLYLLAAFYVTLGVFMVYFQGIVGIILFAIGFVFAIFWVWRLGYVETRFSYQNTEYQFRNLIAVQRRAPIHFHQVWHKLILLLSDFITINLALYLTYWIKFQSGIFGEAVYRPIAEYFSTPVFLLLSLVWIFLFFLNDLYRLEWDVSRFDKIMRITKVITFGIIVISILTTDFQRSLSGSQIFSLLLYWFSLVILINSGRLVIIEIEKRLKIFEYSPKKTLIIGCNDFGKGILQDIRNNPHLIFDVVGFVSKKSKEREFEGKPVLGNYSDLPALIHEHKIEEILITLPESATEDFMKILSLCEAQQVKIKMPPGSHEVFVGQQHRLVSHAYLQIFSESMVLWQWVIKRLFDIFASLAALIILSPFYLSTAVYIGLKFRKSVFFKIPILGKNAIPFGMYVFRITHAPYDYDKNMLYVGTGPSPERLKGYLNFLYKSRFYKLPQLLNVLLGDMSLIGPRPEPLEWYSQYQSSLRFLHRRLTVRPGITGLAQVKYHYELSQKILQERVKFDIFYIENMALRMDLRVLIRTLLLIFKKPPSVSANGVPVMKK